MMNILKLLRALYISSLVIVGPLTIGCSRNVSAGPDVENATQVTFVQLKEATKGEDYFYWIGSDKEFHYFQAEKGFYRLTTKFEIPFFKSKIDRGDKPGTFQMRARTNGEKITGWSSRKDDEGKGARTH